MLKLSMSSKVFTFLGLLLLISSSLSSDAYAQKGELLRRMDAHNNALSSLKAKVVMLKTDAVLGENGDDVSTGMVNYIPERKPRPVYIRVDWAVPNENMIVIGDDYRIIRPAINQALCGKKEGTKQNSRIAGPLAFLSMSRDELNANYEITLPQKDAVTLKDGTKAIYVLLTPKTASKYKFAELWVDGDGMPRQAKVTAPNNDTTTILLTDIYKNIRLDATIFTLDLPKGIKCTKT